MKKSLTLLAAPLLTLCAGAQADFYSHKYAGFGFGNSDRSGFCEVSGAAIAAADSAPDQSFTSLGCDDAGNGWKIYGGWRWTPQMAVETSFHQLSRNELKAEQKLDDGSHQVIDDEITTRLGNLFFVGHWPLAEGLSLFGKLGGGFWFSERDTGFDGEAFFQVAVDENDEPIFELLPFSRSQSSNDSGFQWGYGAGISYSYQNRWTIRAEWENFADVGSEDFFGGDDAETLTLGWSMHF